MPTGMPEVGNNVEDIIHVAAVRIRVVGSGNLRMTLFSLDSVNSQILAPLAMSATNAREPRVLANFISQRAMLTIKTTAINETFAINRVITFAKPMWTEYPG